MTAAEMEGRTGTKVTPAPARTPNARVAKASAWYYIVRREPCRLGGFEIVSTHASKTFEMILRDRKVVYVTATHKSAETFIKHAQAILASAVVI